ncbi:MAG: DUF5110 domain-containing protein, partial [Bacteroidota bacterium]
TLERVPLFVKAGTVLPHYPVRQSTREAVTALLLKAYFAEGTHQSDLYEDAGEGYAYAKGDFLQTQIIQQGASDSLTLTFERSGAYKPAYAKCTLEVIGLPFTIAIAEVDGEGKTWQINDAGWVELELGVTVEKLVLKAK